MDGLDHRRPRTAAEGIEAVVTRLTETIITTHGPSPSTDAIVRELSATMFANRAGAANSLLDAIGEDAEWAAISRLASLGYAPGGDITDRAAFACVPAIAALTTRVERKVGAIAAAALA